MIVRDEKSLALQSPKDLQVGDILLYKNTKNNYFFHAAIVTEIDNDKRVYKITHWVGKAEPYTLAETRLTTAEALKERGMELECFRIKDAKHIPKVLAILRQWVTWAVPYDRQRYAKAEKAVSEFFNVHADQSHNVILSLSPEERQQLLKNHLEKHRLEMERVFEENYMDVVKYASRRDTSPVRPKDAGEYRIGFNCLQGILNVFQASYAAEHVQSITDRWLSNKHAAIFTDASVALKQDFDLKSFLASFPKAFKLYAKTCSVETFRHAFYEDAEHILPLGLLDPLANDDINPDQASSNAACLFAKSNGDAKRNALQVDVIKGSMKGK